MSKCKYLLLFCLISVCLCSVSHAQGIRDKLRGKPGNRDSNSSNQDNQRMDFEGAVWEFKIIDLQESDKSKKTRMLGRIRVKQSALFAVGEVNVIAAEPEMSFEEQAAKYMKKFDSNRDERLDTNELTKLLKSMDKNKSSVTAGSGAGNSTVGKPNNASGKSSGSNLKGDMKDLLAKRMNSAKQDTAEKDGTGGERIGDLTKQSRKEYLFTFDQDDRHPLSGRAELRPDSDKGGVWSGNYYEYVDGKKRKRWRMELRKIDE
ncbi:MAG: hypothetical protein AAFN77_21005 [Planctomycetota bacterium]